MRAVCHPNHIIIETSNNNKTQHMRITANETDFLTSVAKSKRLDYKRTGSLKNLASVNNTECPG